MGSLSDAQSADPAYRRGRGDQVVATSLQEQHPSGEALSGDNFVEAAENGVAGMVTAWPIRFG